jgi:hypothetical protein
VKQGYSKTYVCEKFAFLPKDTSGVPVINVNEVSVESFVEKYERPGVPLVIRGACDHWSARHLWNFQVCYLKYTGAAHHFKQNLGEMLRNRYFKVGEDGREEKRTAHALTTFLR